MADQGFEPEYNDDARGPSRTWLTRRRAAYVLAAFVVASTFLHFTMGPAITAISPSWRYPNMPEQAVTIISVSKLQQQRIVPKPTPQPTPTPFIVKRAHLDLTLVQLREMVNQRQEAANKIRPANKTVEIELRHLVKWKPRTNATAPLAVAEARPKPATMKLQTSARSDTGGASDLAGATQWGDDNPPQVLTRVPVSFGFVPSRTARVKVDVGPDGNVLSVTLDQSSGDASFDRAALDAARRSTYAPATLNGLPIHGTCIVEYPAAVDRT
jgi:TonB family protein